MAAGANRRRLLRSSCDDLKRWWWRVHHLVARVAQNWVMAERVFVRDLEPAEGNKLLSTIRRGSGSVVKWRRSQIVLWSA